MAEYYSIDQILLEETIVDCIFNIDMYGANEIDKENECEENLIVGGHKCKLPFWIAKNLAIT